MVRLNRFMILRRYCKPGDLKSPVALFVLLALGGCPDRSAEEANARFSRKLTVVVTSAPLYTRADALSQKLGALHFGQEVMARQKRSPSTPEGWEEVQPEKQERGYVRESALGTEDLLAKLSGLMKSVEGIEPQASGKTTAATFLRLQPGRDGQGLEKLAPGTSFEMFERRALLKEPPTPPPSPTAGPTPKKVPTPESRKEIWYKVRLEDGRVGYIYTGNLKFQPPADIEQYTRFRRTVAWQKLRMVDAGALGQVGEYLVAYATPGVDFGADFNRIEVYTWGGTGYGTLFAKSDLRGILPIGLSREGQDVYFELRELDAKQPGKLVVRRFHFPHPLKEVSKMTIEADVGLH